jgi:hypothetical protein
MGGMIRDVLDKQLVDRQQRKIPGSRGSGRVRGFFEQAGLKPMSSRRHAL